MRIVWKHDGSTSVWPASFLWDVAQRRRQPPAPRRSLWNRRTLGEAFPAMTHEEIMSGDAPLSRWLTLVEEYGFALATGVPATLEATRELATRIGYVRETIFGGMWDFTANLAFKDTAYTSRPSVRTRTEPTALIRPDFRCFIACNSTATGGDSTLVDGFKVADDIRRSDPQAFEVLSSVKVPAQYLGDGVHLRAEHPIIELDTHGDPIQIAYNNYDRAPFSLPSARMSAFYRALKIFNRMVNDPANEITMRLAPGTALLFDNWRLLHGRRAYQRLSAAVRRLFEQGRLRKQAAGVTRGEVKRWQTQLTRNFGSDNVSPVCAPILSAIQAANAGSLRLLRRRSLYRALDRRGGRSYSRRMS